MLMRLLCVLALAGGLWGQDSFSGVERIVAVGDVHGDFGVAHGGFDR
jgi:hypothetical protein